MSAAMNIKRVAEIVAELTAMKFFPCDEHGRLAVVRIVAEMSSSEDQVRWLVKRMLSLYNEWPGPLEMRACFCSKFKPRDGVNAYSTTFADGIPSENPKRNQQFIASAPAQRYIESGEPPAAVTADDRLQRAVEKAAKHLNRIERKKHEVPPEMLITQRDIDEAVANFRRQKALEAEAKARAEMEGTK